MKRALLFTQKKTYLSAAPAPSCPVGFGKEASMSFQPTLCGCKPGRISTDRGLSEKKQGHPPLQQHGTEDVLTAGGGSAFLSLTLEI